VANPARFRLQLWIAAASLLAACGNPAESSTNSPAEGNARQAERRDYCNFLPTVARAVDEHSRIHVAVDQKSGPREAMELQKAGLSVATLSARASELAPASLRSAWRNFAYVYRWQAGELAGTKRPDRVLLDLELGSIEWSAAAYDTGIPLDFDAKDRCGFDPNLRQQVD
jgi:hypothetical protein